MHSWKKFNDKTYKNNKRQHFSIGKNKIDNNQPVWHGIMQGNAATPKC